MAASEALHARHQLWDGTWEVLRAQGAAAGETAARVRVAAAV